MKKKNNFFFFFINLYYDIIFIECDDMDKELLRKKIEFLVELYYGKFDFLRKESLDVLKKKALDKYLDSG